MKLILTLVLICRMIPLDATPLPRRVYLGIRMETLTDDARNIIGLKERFGVLISEVLPNSTAEKAGFKKGDILLSIDTFKVNNPSGLIQYLLKCTDCHKFNYSLFRDKKILKGQSEFMRFPLEHYTGIEMEYTASESASGKQRIIMSKPLKSGKRPLVVFIGGIGCYSLDSPHDSMRSEIRLLNQLTRAGYICARLEKPGTGDNAGYSTPCNQISFAMETESYLASVRALKLRPDIDSNSVFILGHSMGGLFAPLVAEKTNIKGIIAYGTIGSNFIDYLAKTRRTIAEAFAMNPVETDNLIKDFCTCSFYYFDLNLSSAEAAEKKNVCKEYLSVFDLRSRAYNSELYAFNIPSVWKNFGGKALLVYGESDYIASKEDHQILVKTINFYHPGNAEYAGIPDTDHGMNLAKDFAEAAQNPGSYNEQLGKSILTWLNKIMET